MAASALRIPLRLQRCARPVPGRSPAAGDRSGFPCGVAIACAAGIEQPLRFGERLAIAPAQLQHGHQPDVIRPAQFGDELRAGRALRGLLVRPLRNGRALSARLPAAATLRRTPHFDSARRASSATSARASCSPFTASSSNPSTECASPVRERRVPGSPGNRRPVGAQPRRAERRLRVAGVRARVSADSTSVRTMSTGLGSGKPRRIASDFPSMSWAC